MRTPWRTLLGIFQTGFALMVLAGSSFEVVNLLVPSLLPEIQDLPMMRMHHENRVVYWWTLLSNLANVPLAALLATGGIGLFAQRPWASGISVRAALGMLLIVVGAAVISFVYLVPPNLELFRSAVPEEHAQGLIMLISVASALWGMAFMLTLLLLGHRRLRAA